MGMNTRLNSIHQVGVQINKNKGNKHHDMINRLEVERDFLKDSITSATDEFGEITNNREDDTFERGMPSRPNYQIKKEMNERTVSDFELFSNKPTQKVKYNDPNSNYAEIDSPTKISEHIQDKNICSNGINNLGIFLFNNLTKIVNSDFIYSPVSLYDVFAAIYLGSDGNTEIELKNYFNFPRRDILNNGLTDHIEKMAVIGQSIPFAIGSCLLFSDELEFNASFCKYIGKFTKIRKVNRAYAENESMKMNEIINNITNNKMRSSITSNNVFDLSVLFLNYGYIEPVFDYEVKSVITDVFTAANGDPSKMQFMYSTTQTVGYYQGPTLQVMEIKCSGVDLVMGFILGNDPLSDKTFTTIMENVKPTNIQQILIPMFRTKTKLRYTNILKQTELKTVFMDLNLPELFSSPAQLDDVIQNLEINVTNKCKKVSKVGSQGYRGGVDFIINKSFRYYLRTSSTKTLLLMGKY